MNAASNEAYIGWLHENCYLMGEAMTLLIGKDKFIKGVFWLGQWVNFCLLGEILSRLQGFPQTFGGRGTVHTWATKQH